MAQLIRKNMIYAGVGPGLHVTNDAAPRVERNEFFGNQGPAILIDNGANPTVPLRPPSLRQFRRGSGLGFQAKVLKTC